MYKSGGTCEGPCMRAWSAHVPCMCMTDDWVGEGRVAGHVSARMHAAGVVQMQALGG